MTESTRSSIDEMRARLETAIVDASSEVSRLEHLERVLLVCARAKVHAAWMRARTAFAEDEE